MTKRLVWLAVVVLSVMILEAVFWKYASIGDPCPSQGPVHYFTGESNVADGTLLGSSPAFAYPGKALKFIDEFYPTLTEAVLEIGKHHPLSRQASNIGAKDGKSMGDEVYEMFHDHSFAGLAVEASGRWRKDLHANLPANNITKVIGFATPHGCPRDQTAAGLPKNLDALKMDNDSFDGPVLLGCLQGFRPKVIFAEVNIWVPPPFAYCSLWSDAKEAFPDSTVGTSGAPQGDKSFGCSLMWMHVHLAALGYNLIAMRGYHSPGETGTDAMWVAKEFDVFGDIPRDPITVWRNWLATGAYERYAAKHAHTGNKIYITDGQRWLSEWEAHPGREAAIIKEIWETISAHHAKLGIRRPFVVDAYPSRAIMP